MTPAEAIEAAELAAAEIRYRHQVAREAASTGYDRGRTAGYLQAVTDIKAAQHGLVLDAEIEERRWGPGGREHFADPRPGDFPGVKKEAERERELEAGLHARCRLERRV